MDSITRATGTSRSYKGSYVGQYFVGLARVMIRNLGETETHECHYRSLGDLTYCGATGTPREIADHVVIAHQPKMFSGAESARKDLFERVRRGE